MSVADSLEIELIKDVSGFIGDPYGFVMYAFPWGVPGTALEHYNAPDEWQADILKTLGNEIRARKFNGVDAVKPILMAVSSGHGCGKSTLTAWLILYIMSTRPFARGVVTANTYPQLQTKTWGELSKWHKLSINSHWFEYSGSKGNLSLVRASSKENWRIDGAANSEHQSEAFAGLHNANSATVFVFDEASAIPDKIWEVAQGATTDGEPFVFAFGNPTRVSGWFIDAINDTSGRWITRTVDSRKAKMTNKPLIETWINDYGINSDFVRVRVLGVPPNAASNQLISNAHVRAAMDGGLNPEEYQYMTTIIGVDVAREGLDESVVVVRQGRKVVEIKTFVGLDNIQLALRVAEIYKKYPRVDGLLVDVVGTGSGVVDYLKNTGYPVVGVISGATPADPKRFLNVRAEMWVRMAEWFAEGQCEIPDDPVLAKQLGSQEYFFNLKEQYQLPSKKDMKAAGVPSPDRADALAFTFSKVIHHSKTQQSFEPDWN